MTAPATVHRFSLLHDDRLVVSASDDVLPAVLPWLPLHAAPVHGETAAEPRATIVVERAGAGAPPSGPSSSPPLLHFAGIRAHESEDGVVMLDGGPTTHGRVALATLGARLATPDASASDDADARALGGLYSMLTLAAALLVGRLGGALVHAGAVVDPDGEAWLLVGDTHAGKTTTCVSLVAAGWRYLADDQVVLRGDGADGIVVEGWPRRAHLDEGWFDAVVTGTRATVDLRARWGDRWVRRAPLGGMLFPAVRADLPTSATPIHSAAAFASVVRQSPWLLADRGAAQPVMQLLRRVATRPAFAMSLGRDGYARGELLASRLLEARLARADGGTAR